MRRHLSGDDRDIRGAGERPFHDRQRARSENFVHPESYLGISYTDDFVIIQITANDTRTLWAKAGVLCPHRIFVAENPGLRKEDVFINLVECKKENWSFGNGIAQYV